MEMAVDESVLKSPLTVKEVAQRLICHPRTVWRFEGQGLIPQARRFGRKVFWDREEFDEWYMNSGRN